MGRKLHYRAGSFYRVSDHTGFPVRAENTLKMWNSLIVERATFEPRQPQDLVRGVKDQQNVPDARPLAPAQFIGPIYTTLADATTPGQTVITLTSTAGLTIGDAIGLMMDDGSLWTTGVLNILPDDQIQTASGAPLNAASGNSVVDYRTAWVDEPPFPIGADVPFGDEYTIIGG